MTPTLRAVVERENGAWLTLDGACAAEEFVAVVAAYNDVPIEDLAAAEDLTAPGGLILTDADTVIVPGCCCGLENWRDWAGASAPWLGHDPTPTMTFGDRITVRQDAGSPALPSISLSRAQLSDLLDGVHRDLTAFTAVLAAWAARHVADGEAFTAAIDRAFAFTAPLAWTAT